MAAYIIDSILVFLMLLIARLLMAGVMSLLEGTFLSGNVLFQYTLKDIILYVLQVVYFILFTYCTGTTPGKRLMNLRVISAEEEKLSLIDVIYRETIGRFLCGISIGIGYIVAGVDKEKRGIHDMLCDTRVIYAKKIKVFPSEAFKVPPAGPVPRQVPPQDMQTPPTGPVPRQVPPQNMQVPPQDAQTPPAGPVPGQVPPQNMQTPPRKLDGAYHMTRPEEENQERNS